MNGDTLRRSRFRILNAHGDPIHGDIRSISEPGTVPSLIVCHSFMAFKEWGFFPYASSRLAMMGFNVITFNFSLNGVVGDQNRITEFEKFASNTFSRELEDVQCVVDAELEGTLDGMRRPGITGRVGLLGHSRGGGVAIMQASRDPRVTALATWSAISRFDRWNEHQKSQWRSKGFLPLAKDSTVSPLRLGIGLLNDVEAKKNELDLDAAASKIGVPWLILHGREDVTVKANEAEHLYACSNTNFSELQVLEHAGHLYNAAAESEDHYQTMNRVLEITGKWFQRHLTQE